ncbi:uncharacterized protein K489DRAFT_376306 [Dissoconium aciculare CBS 342.82]|uniref:Uncharacterized protein n=1 Tax=Dissoconium aciculare CBS 342.82 TaxID=1314786 RepID=A0A6J3MD15_9PEZI|nr:uncharacterized protein K489DRAFT_376306 [Dissoconium aciculare CBS 342.82]KAF1825920.1 hypothetical protein K489DRAFT_376306 [Dissoconium aciculare CBS 342.82]
MPEPNFDRLPNEFLDIVTGCLDVEGICAMRLMNRSVCLRATMQSQFLALFQKSTRLVLSRSRLASLALLTRDIRIARCIQSLTIVGRAYSIFGRSQQNDEPLKELLRQQADDIQLRNESLDVRYLSQILANLAVSQPHRLDSVSVEIFVYSSDMRSPKMCSKAGGFEIPGVLQACSNTFSLVIQALRRSRVRIRNLNFFNSKPEGLEYAIPSPALNQLGNRHLSRVTALSDLRSLSMRITEGPLPERIAELGKNHEDKVEKIRESLSLSGMCSMLDYCPHLEVLGLAPYYKESFHDLTKRYRGLRQSLRVEQVGRLLDVHIVRLRKLCLAGFAMPTKDFCAFLERHASTLQTIELKHIKFKGRISLESVFALLASDLFHLQAIFLDDIHEASLIQFLGPSHEASIRISGFHIRRIRYHSWGEGTKQLITYAPFSRPVSGTMEYLDYRRQTMEEFGTLKWK